MTIQMHCWGGLLWPIFLCLVRRWPQDEVRRHSALCRERQKTGWMVGSNKYRTFTLLFLSSVEAKVSCELFHFTDVVQVRMQRRYIWKWSYRINIVILSHNHNVFWNISGWEDATIYTFASENNLKDTFTFHQILIKTIVRPPYKHCKEVLFSAIIPSFLACH